MKYCPACDRGYLSLLDLRAHIKKAQAEGDENHIDIADLEGWDETSAGKPETRGNIAPIEET